MSANGALLLLDVQSTTAARGAETTALFRPSWARGFAHVNAIGSYRLMESLHSGWWDDTFLLEGEVSQEGAHQGPKIFSAEFRVH